MHKLFALDSQSCWCQAMTSVNFLLRVCRLATTAKQLRFWRLFITHKSLNKPWKCVCLNIKRELLLQPWRLLPCHKSSYLSGTHQVTEFSVTTRTESCQSKRRTAEAFFRESAQFDAPQQFWNLKIAERPVYTNAAFSWWNTHIAAHHFTIRTVIHEVFKQILMQKPLWQFNTGNSSKRKILNTKTRRAGFAAEKLWATMCCVIHLKVIVKLLLVISGSQNLTKEWETVVCYYWTRGSEKKQPK